MRASFTVLLFILQYCTKAVSGDNWPNFPFNPPPSSDPFETDSFFTKSPSFNDPFSSPLFKTPFIKDPFINDPFFSPSHLTANPPTFLPLTSNKNKDSLFDSSSDEHSDYHVCPICHAYHKKPPKVGDSYAGAVSSIPLKPPSNSHPGAGLALAGGLLATAPSHPNPSPNYYSPPNSKPVLAYKPPSSVPSTKNYHKKHGTSSSSSSSSSSDEKKKRNGSSKWKTGAVLGGGVLAGAALASANNKPSKPPVNNYYPPTQSPSHGVYHKPSKQGSSSSSEDKKNKHKWSPGAALAAGAITGGALVYAGSKPSKPPVNNYHPPTHTPSVNHIPSKQGSSSSYADHKWPPGAALAGGALAGGLLASANSKPSSYSKPPPVSQATATKPHGCSYCIRETCDPASCREAPNFNATRDADRLQKAIKGLGTDEKTLIDILTQRSDEQIEEIRQEYVRCGRTMSSDLEGDTSFKTQELLDALVTPRSLFYAEQLEHAFKKKDTDTMIEIFTSLSDCAIREVSSEYSKRFRKALPQSIEKKTCSDFENFLLELAKGNRAPNGPVDVAAAKKDADALINAGVNKWFGTDEAKFIDIFATRSWVQLKEVLKQYDLKRSPGIEKDIKSETSGQLEKGLLTLVKNIKDQPAYFAEQLENSLNTLLLPVPNDNHKLIRIMRGRCGVDLGDIRDAYPKVKEHKGKQLASRLASKTYMDYQAALLAMIKK